MKRGIMEVDTMDAILAQNKAMAQQLTTLNKKLENLDVAAIDQPLEKVNYMGNQQRQPYDDPTSNIYNSGWRNHTNFGWGGNQNPKNNHFQNHPPYQPFHPPPFP
ncbi:hypothetical protein PIB30_070671 [Stylosanthes scabra]|uniref:Uncharacterized protein n=1 Tax=Stylosanthes scabra TaxID=79078 RepID=A0ABU6XLR9_9FABA|nr:hypothetical protein [Stylosanthes scabra]